MAPNKFATMLHRRTNKITRVLIYAFLEWTLIFLLLLNSLFSYFILKFALYFGLKPPCFLCARLDHLLDSHRKEKHRKSNTSSYTDIICEQHAAELSKIGYCSHHRKLVESQIMCENCSSPPTSDEPDCTEDDAPAKKCSCCDGVISPITKVSSLDFVIKERESLGGGCFSDQIVQVGSDQSDDQTNFGYQVLGDCTEEDNDKSEDDVILEAEKEPLLKNNDDDHNGNKNKEIISFTAQNLCPDMLPQHLEFFIDHDDYRLIPVEFVDEESIKVERQGEETSKVVGDDEKKGTSESSREFDLVFEGDELHCPGSEATPTKDLPSIHEEEEESMIENFHIYKDEEILEDSDSFELHFEGGDLLAAGCETENSQIKEEKMDHSEAFEQNFEGDECDSGCEIVGTDLPEEEEEASAKDKLEDGENEEVKKDDSEISQPIKEEEKEREVECTLLVEKQEEIATPESDNIVDEQERDYQATEADNQATADTHSVSEEDEPAHLKSDEPDTEEQNQISADNKSLIHVSEDDTAALHSRSCEIESERNHDPTSELLMVVDESPTLCEQEGHTIADNVVSEVSNSCPRDAETGEGALDAKVGMSHNDLEEERIPDTPTSTESLHRKLLLLERRESATEESFDGMTTISEQGSITETIEKLKVDLLAERKTLRALYKELEEERNASAISANQTMAMITRLQEEKATMQMEASQYQRMMEEQSEYDQEALQMMNELVVKREKEKQELEKELEVYRRKVIDYEEREKMRILSRRRSRNSSASCSYGEESDGVSIDLNQETKDQEEEGGSPKYPLCQQENGHQDTPADAVLCLQDPLIGFEDERQAILEQLKVLEEKLFTLAEEEEEQFENMKPFEQLYEENSKDFDGINGNGVDSNGFSHVNGQHQQERRINGSMPKKLLLPLFDAAESLESPNGELFNGTDDGFHITKFELEKKRFALEEEVDQVYERLQALEADREFLKHCIGSIRKGDKGLDLLQEILQHLRDLKNVEIQAVKNMDHCASV